MIEKNDFIANLFDKFLKKDPDPFFKMVGSGSGFAEKNEADPKHWH